MYCLMRQEVETVTCSSHINKQTQSLYTHHIKTYFSAPYCSNSSGYIKSNKTAFCLRSETNSSKDNMANKGPNNMLILLVYSSVLYSIIKYRNFCVNKIVIMLFSKLQLSLLVDKKKWPDIGIILSWNLQDQYLLLN